MYSCFLNGNNVSNDFSAMLDEASAPNPYQTLSSQFRGAHNRLNSDKQKLIAAEITEKVLRPIDEALKSFQSLQQRITQRNELHSELEYYLNKVHDLNKEREERTLKGKSETPKNVEKFDRNQQKLDTSRNEYTTFTSVLMADIMSAWNGRIEVIGPALAAFVEAEKHFLAFYREELDEVNKSEQLTTPPAEVRTSPVDPSTIPQPMIAGDLQNRATTGEEVAAGRPIGQPATPSNYYQQPPLAQQRSNAAETPRSSFGSEGQPSMQQAGLAQTTSMSQQTPRSQVASATPRGVGQAAGSGLYVASDTNPSPEEQQGATTTSSNIVIDPTSVQREQSGYISHATAVPQPQQSPEQPTQVQQAQQAQQQWAQPQTSPIQQQQQWTQPQTSPVQQQQQWSQPQSSPQQQQAAAAQQWTDQSPTQGESLSQVSQLPSQASDASQASVNATDLNPYASGGAISKLQGEEESKRQRFEEEQKTRGEIDA